MVTEIRIHNTADSTHWAWIVTTDEGEGLREWRCTKGHSSNREWFTLADVINNAEVHIEHGCGR